MQIRSTTFQESYFEFDLKLSDRHNFAEEKIEVISSRKKICVQRMEWEVSKNSFGAWQEWELLG